MMPLTDGERDIVREQEADSRPDRCPGCEELVCCCDEPAEACPVCGELHEDHERCIDGQVGEALWPEDTNDQDIPW